MAKSSGGGSPAANAGVSVPSGGGKGVRMGDKGSFAGPPRGQSHPSRVSQPRTKAQNNQPSRAESSKAQRRATGIGASAGTGSQINLLNAAEELRRKQQRYDQIGIADNQKTASSSRIVSNNRLSEQIALINADRNAQMGAQAAQNYAAKMARSDQQALAHQQSEHEANLARMQARSSENVARIQAAAQALSARTGLVGQMLSGLSAGAQNYRYWG